MHYIAYCILYTSYYILYIINYKLHTTSCCILYIIYYIFFITSTNKNKVTNFLPNSSYFQLTGAAVVGLGIFILLDLSPQYGYNYIMYFAHLYGFNQKPGIFKAALLMVVGGLIVIVYGIVSLVTFCRRSYKYMFTVSVELIEAMVQCCLLHYNSIIFQYSFGYSRNYMLTGIHSV